MKSFADVTLMYFSITFTLEFRVGDCLSQSFLYERMHNFGIGNRVIPNYRRLHKYEYPEPLPKTTRSPDLLKSPFKNLYQGFRRPNDTRVYRRKFEFAAQNTGHHVICEGMFDCIITHLAIETTGGIPILLRGGAGYRYFVTVTKGKPGDELKGTVRAYCVKKPDEYYLNSHNSS